jgi:hypothetical protein
MALTLVEASKKYSGEVVRSATIEMFAKQSDILAALPFEDIPGGSVKYDQEGVLPGVAFRGVNESYTESTGVLNPVVDSVYILGGDIDVDVALIKTRGPAVRTSQTAMKVKALADAWAQKLIKGDNASDPREFDGLQTRLTGAQKISAGSTSGGAALSLAKLDELIDAVDNPTHLIMNKAMRRRLTTAARSTSVGGFISYSKDEFGRTVTRYNDLPILVTNNGSTEALPFTEASEVGAATSTSIYCVSFGSGRLVGIQNGDMDARDLGEIDSKPVARLRVEYLAGIALYHGRAAARLWSIGNLAVVA